MERVPGVDRPPKKIYSITEAGSETLRAWIEQPIADCGSLKAFVMRLVLADSHTRPILSAHLRQRREQVASHRASLAGHANAADAGPNLGQQLAIDYGLALAAAELAWLDTTLDRFQDVRSPQEAVQQDKGTPAS